MALSTPDGPLKRSATCIIVSAKEDTGGHGNEDVSLRRTRAATLYGAFAGTECQVTTSARTYGRTACSVRAPPTCQMPPLGVEVGLVGQTALHDVGAVVGARSGRRHAAAVGTVSHLHNGPHALLAQLCLG